MATEIGKLVAIFEADPTPFIQGRKQVEAEQRRSARSIDQIEKELTRQVIAEARRRESETVRAARQAENEIKQAARRTATEQEQSAKRAAKAERDSYRAALADIKNIENQRRQIMTQNSRAIEGLAKREADARIRENRRALTQITSQLNQQRRVSQGSFSPFIAGVAGGATALLGLSFASQFRRAASAVFEFSARLENTKIAFTTMIGSADEAMKHLRDLQQFALTTPFDFPDLVEASQRMQALGFQAKDVVPVLNDVGNAVAAAGGGSERLDRVVLALSQMQSKGKVMTQELNQLAEAGIPAWKIMEQQLGMTRDKLVKLVEDGKISAQVFLTAFRQFSRANFGDLMEKQSRTFTGALSNIKDGLLQTSNTAFEPLFKKITEITVRMADEISKGKPTLEKAIQNLASGLGEAAAHLGAMLGKAVADGMYNTFLDTARLDFDSIAQRYMPIARGIGIGLGRAIREGLEVAFNKAGGLFVTSAQPKGHQLFTLDPVTGRRIPYNQRLQDEGEFAIAGGAGQFSQGAGPRSSRTSLLSPTGGGGRGGGGGGRDVVGEAIRRRQQELRSFLESLKIEEEQIRRSYENRETKIASYVRAIGRLEDESHNAIMQALKDEQALVNRIRDPGQRLTASADIEVRRLQEALRHLRSRWEIEDDIKNVTRERIALVETEIRQLQRMRFASDVILQDLGRGSVQFAGDASRPRRQETFIKGGIDGGDEGKFPIRDYYGELDRLEERSRRWAFELTNLLDRAIYDGFEGGIRRGFQSLMISILDLVKNVFLRQLENALSNALSGAGRKGGGIFGFITSALVGSLAGGIGGSGGKGAISGGGYAGKFQYGGNIPLGKFGIVHEGEKVIATPHGAMVIPNQITNNSGGNTFVNITIPEARAADSYKHKPARRELAQQIAASVQGALR